MIINCMNIQRTQGNELYKSTVFLMQLPQVCRIYYFNHTIILYNTLILNRNYR